MTVNKKGGGRNEQKRNEQRAAEANAREELARAKLQELRSIPVARRPLDYELRIGEQQGILKRARLQGRKSETHSRKGKAGRR